MTLIVTTPFMSFIPQATVLTDLDAIIKWAIETRREAHGNDELQEELNVILNKAYEEKWLRKNR